MSDYEVERFQVGRCTVKIEIDQDPRNPRKENDNVGTMACWHRRYDLGDEQPKETAGEYLLDLAREAISVKYPEALLVKNREAILNKHYTRLPIFLYDHSGLTISTGAFSCPWDSGQVGFIYCSLEKAQEEWGTPDSKKKGWDGEASYTLKEDGTKRTLREATISYMEGEVREYDAYLTGEVYEYAIEVDDEVVGSCCGFVGDLKYVREEARGEAEAIDKELAADEAKEAAEREEMECRDVITA